MNDDQKKIATFWFGLGCMSVFGFLSLRSDKYEIVFNLIFVFLIIYYFLILKVIEEKIDSGKGVNLIVEECRNNKIYRWVIIAFYMFVGISAIYLLANPSIGELIGRNTSMSTFVILLSLSPLLYPVIKRQIINYKNLGKNGN